MTSVAPPLLGGGLSKRKRGGNPKEKEDFAITTCVNKKFGAGVRAASFRRKSGTPDRRRSRSRLFEVIGEAGQNR